jgi:hypothetical protein
MPFMYDAGLGRRAPPDEFLIGGKGEGRAARCNGQGPSTGNCPTEEDWIPGGHRRMVRRPLIVISFRKCW